MTTKKSNPQDATLRNVRASHTADDAQNSDIKAIRLALNDFSDRLAAVEAKIAQVLPSEVKPT